MINFCNQAGRALQHVVQNPFGAEFVYVPSNGPMVTLGSFLNFAGYNDYLERTVGVTRIALGLVALAFSKEVKQRLTCVAQVGRGILELNGNCEFYLLLVDVAATIYMLASKLYQNANQFFAKKDSNPV